MRRTKIVCTIGPASSKRRVLERLMRAGMDVARLNFSHGTHAEHAQVIANLRELATRLGRPLAILQDLCGPKVRLGTFSTPSIILRQGQRVGFQNREVMEAGSAILPLPVPEMLGALKPRCTLLLDDGKVAFRVTDCQGAPGDPDRIVWARCLVGGELKPHKGVTAPGVTFQVDAVTAKDREDLRFGLKQGVDWVAASYVRCAEDLAPLFEIMQEEGRTVPLLVKVEKAEAVRNLESLLEVVQGIMVARGDLGVEMPLYEVPIIQKQIIRACNRAGKPVITATQMLESMIENPRPTRAEATDVANAILDGTDAVMLSGETAVGRFPIDTVQIMAKIALEAEAAFFKEAVYAQRLGPPRDVTSSMARATAAIASELNARAILCATTSGSTALRVAQYRPRVPILGATTDPDTYHRLALSWGILPCLIPPVTDTDTMMQTTIEAAQRIKLVKVNDRVILTAGVPVNNPGTTNLIKVHTVGQPLDPPQTH